MLAWKWLRFGALPFFKRRYFELEIVGSVCFRYVTLFELLEALIISRKTK